MKIRIDQLAGALRNSLAPAYIVSGDEPLQIIEAQDMIREKARTLDYGSRELLDFEHQPDWSKVLMLANERSLFSQKRILDIRLNQKPDRNGQSTLLELVESPREETLLLIQLPKLSSKEIKTAWFQKMEQKVVHIQIWPLEGDRLIRWLDQRLNSRGLLADQSGLRLLRTRVEGNLLAASQEIEKLKILYGSGQLSDRMILDAVADNSRYSVFDFAEELLAGHPARLQHMLKALRQAGIAPPIVIWAITRELRMLHRLKTGINQGENFERLANMHRLWDRHKQVLSIAVQRLSLPKIRQALLETAKMDRMSKGLGTGDPWHQFSVLCNTLSREIQTNSSEKTRT